MNNPRGPVVRSVAFVSALCFCHAVCLCLAGCKSKDAQGATGGPPFMSAAASAPPQPAGDEAPPPDKTGGFDGKRAFEVLAKLVGFGPRPSGSPALAKTQTYILSELSSYGCPVDTDAFNAQTPVGPVAMKNILVKIPGDKPGIILLGTHYDTKKLDNFVGADDGGSSTAVMLELARVLCPQHGAHPVWIAFFDGEEAIRQWTDTDSRYGSRQMSAKLAMSGDLPKIKEFLLADMVGCRDLRFRRDSNSTAALTDLVWTTAKNLGYATVFVNDDTSVEDDHISFLKRGVPSVDIINMDIMNSYWHTPQDTLDKVSAKSLAITGHVFLETVKQLQSK